MDINADTVVLFLGYYAILLFSLSFHECAHALTAKWGGDHTSAYQGRITLNPIAHIDPVGTVVMPILGFFSGFPLLAWAKPVPVQELNFPRSSWGAVVAVAGPVSNLILAFGAALLRSALGLASDGSADGFGVSSISLLGGSEGMPVTALGVVSAGLEAMILLNVALAVFNMIPFPPLDGSHVAWHLWIKYSPRLSQIYVAIMPFSFFLLYALLWIPGFKMLLAVLIFAGLYAVQWATTLGF